MAFGAQSALVFLHGFALDSRMWRRQVAAFAYDYPVLTVDLPGFGPQSRDVGEVDPALEVVRAMDVGAVSSAHFVANSYGAAVAIDFAFKYPQRIGSLTLAGPLLLGRRTGIDAWPRCVSLAGEGDRATAVEIWLDDPLFEGLRSDEALFEEMFPAIDKVVPGVRAMVETTRIDRWRPAVLMSRPGTYAAVAELVRHIDPASPVQLAGDYLSASSTNGCAVSGELAAARLAAQEVPR